MTIDTFVGGWYLCFSSPSGHCWRHKPTHHLLSYRPLFFVVGRGAAVLESGSW